MGDESLQEEALASPVPRQHDSAQHSGSRSPGCLLELDGGCLCLVSRCPPFPVPPRAGGPHTETTFPWALFCFKVPRLQSPRFSSVWEEAKPMDPRCTVPQASPCPRLGLLTWRGLSCLLSRWQSGLGHVCPAVALRMPESPAPRWHSGSAKQMQAQGWSLHLPTSDTRQS